MAETHKDHQKFQEIFLSRPTKRVDLTKLQANLGTWRVQNDGATCITCPLCDTEFNASEVAIDGTVGARWRKKSQQSRCPKCLFMLRSVIGTTVQLGDREIKPLEYSPTERPHGHVIVLPPALSSDMLDWLYQATEAHIEEFYPGCTIEHLGAFADGATGPWDCSGTFDIYYGIFDIDGKEWKKSWLIYRLYIMSEYITSNILVRPQLEADRVHKANLERQTSTRCFYLQNIG